MLRCWQRWDPWQQQLWKNDWFSSLCYQVRTVHRYDNINQHNQTNLFYCSGAICLLCQKDMRRMLASRLTLWQQIPASSLRSERQCFFFSVFQRHFFHHVASQQLFICRYNALMGRRRPFVESLRSYRDSMLLIPAFSFGHNTPVSLRAFYTIEDFESPTQPIFFNPDYLQSLAVFWRSQGLRTVRLSTGIIMASLALELCSDVHLYGFWPFSFHPQGHHNLTNHYYDNRQTKMKFHAMPSEFEFLLRLHSRGVLRLHLGYCGQGDK